MSGVPGVTGVAAGGDPARWLDPAVLSELTSLELVARAVVDGFLNGLHRSLQLGFSLEFADYRPYAPGDDPRFIDWNADARTGRTYLKRHLGETTTQLMLLLDASASMGVAGRGVGKLRYAKFLCAALAWLAARQHDAAGLLVFDDAVREYRSPKARTGQLGRLLHALEAAPARAGTHIEGALRTLEQRAPRRGLVAVVSDFYCDAASLLESVRPLAHRGQDVMLFQVLDPDERAPRLGRTDLLVDAETGREMHVSPEFASREYPERLRAHVESLGRVAGAVGADHVVLDTEAPLGGALRAYLRFRQRRGC